MRPLIAIAAAGVALRLLLVAFTPAWSVTTDGARFMRLAETGMAGTAFLPPLYPLFIALVERIAGSGVPPVRIVQSLLGGATILLTGRLARRFVPRDAAPAGPSPRRATEPRDRAERIAAGLAAFAPPLLLADVTVMSESLAALLAAGYLVCASGEGGGPLTVRAGEAEGRAGATARAALTGALLGLGALCRAPLLAYALLRGAAMFLPGAGRAASAGARRAAVVSTAVALLVVAPWALRNTLLFDRPIPVSTNGGYNFWKSFNPATTGTEAGYGPGPFEGLPERDYDAAGYAAGLRFIREHPLRAAALAPLKIGYLWGLERFFFIGLRDGTWGPLPLVVPIVLLIAIPATQVMWLLLAPSGLANAPRGPARREALLLLGFACLFHLVFNAEARYHLPLLPLLFAAAAARLGGCGAEAPPRGKNGTGPPGREASRGRMRFLTPAVATAVLSFWIFEVLSEREQILEALGGGMTGPGPAPGP